MVISGVNTVTYNGDGITTAWPYTYEVTDASEIRIQLNNADGTAVIVESDYYVDLINSTVYYPGYAPGSEPPEAEQPPKVQEGQTITVYREIPITQESDLGDKWPFDVIEKGLDKLTMIAQQIDSGTKRTIDNALASMEMLADVVVDSDELQHITDQYNAIDVNAATATAKATAAANSATAAAASATAAANSASSAQTTATALTNFLETKETLTAPAVDPTLTISGAAADAKVVGDTFSSTKAEMSLFGVDDLLWDNCNPASKTQGGVTGTVDYTNKIVTVTSNGSASTGSFVLNFFGSSSGFPSWLQKGKKYYAHIYSSDSNIRFNIIEFYADDTYSDVVPYFSNGCREFEFSPNAVKATIRLHIPSGTVVSGVVRPFISETLTLGELGTNSLTKSEASSFGIDDYLWDNTNPAGNSSGDVTKTVDKVNKTVTLTGTASAFNILNFFESVNGFPTWLQKGKRYYAHIYGGDVALQITEFYADDSYTRIVDIKNGFVEFEFSNDATKASIRLAINTGAVTNCVVRPFISESLSLGELTGLFENESALKSNEMELYTDFEWSTGRWNASGSVSGSGYHSQLLPIRPSTTYYVGYESDSSSAVREAFFDASGIFLSAVTFGDFTEVNYRKPDATGTFSNYVRIFSFTSPSNAAYISHNSARVNATVYRDYVASKPVYALTGTGNYIIPAGDAVYQKNKNRKLCMIGTSQLMTDRLSRTGNFDDSGTDKTQYVVGIPEYLLPWWNTCDVYGYSNASMMPFDGEDVLSIYERVVTNELDLTAYDDFVITHSSSGITATNIGTLTNAEDLGDNTTFIGALRQIIDYIYTQNPKAKIWVQTRITRQHLSNPTRLAQIKQANQAIRDMAELLSIPVIDCERESGFNAYTAPYWCYDELGHYNHLGGMMMGLFFRKCILGF